MDCIVVDNEEQAKRLQIIILKGLVYPRAPLSCDEDEWAGDLSQYNGKILGVDYDWIWKTHRRAGVADISSRSIFPSNHHKKSTEF